MQLNWHHLGCYLYLRVSIQILESLLRDALRRMHPSLLPMLALPILFYFANTPGRPQAACCALLPLVYHRVTCRRIHVAQCCMHVSFVHQEYEEEELFRRKSCWIFFWSLWCTCLLECALVPLFNTFVLPTLNCIIQHQPTRVLTHTLS